MKFFIDLLKVKDPEKPSECSFSQSRVYLFLSVMVLLGMSVSSYFLDFDNQNFQYSMDTVFWLAMFFGGYALVGKGMKYQHLQKTISMREDGDKKGVMKG